MAIPVAPVFDRVRLIPRPNDFLNRNVGASGELFYEKETKTLRVYNGIDRGGFEIVSQDRLRINAAKAEIATVKYNVTVGTDGSGNKYVFNGDGVYAPALSFTVGYTYVFEQSNFTNLYFPNAEGAAINQHPLNFSQTANGELGGGLTFLDGVVYLLEDLVVDKETYWNKFSRSTKRQVQITCTSTSPATLYYWCQNHTNMGNTITVGTAAAGGGGASLAVSDTAPDSPSAGNIWYNSTSGYLYVYIEDADSSQWVQPAAGNVFSGSYSDLVGAPTLATIATTGAYSDLISPPTIPSSIDDLSDVDTTTVAPTNGQAIVWDTATTSWKPGSVAGGGGGYNQSLNTTDDVVFDSVTSPSIISTGLGVTNFTSSTSLTLSATDGVFLSGIARSSEVVGNKTGASSIVDHSLATASVWRHASIAANFTANFTNVPTTDNRVIGVALVLVQGASAYMPTAVTIAGSSTTINWEDGTTPTGNANKTDMVTFALIRTGGAWSVIGSLTSYG
jgi:hypothetical protein